MKWSKLKARAESYLAEPLQNEMFYYMTRYGESDSYTMARAWIVYKKEEVASFSEVLWMGKNQELASKIFAELQIDENISLQTDPHLWWDARKQASEILANEGIFSTEQFVHSLYQYINLSIVNSIADPNPLIRAFAVMDKRVGRRRLTQLTLKPDKSVIVQRMFAIRCKAESIQSSIPLSANNQDIGVR